MTHSWLKADNLKRNLSLHHSLYQLIAHYSLVQTLREFLQHDSVQVYHLQGERNVRSVKPSATAKLFVGPLVYSSFVVDAGYVQNLQMYLL